MGYMCNNVLTDLDNFPTEQLFSLDVQAVYILTAAFIKVANKKAIKHGPSIAVHEKSADLKSSPQIL